MAVASCSCLVSLFLSLLVVACSTSPAPSSVTPKTIGSTPPTPITAYHGHTSTVFAVAWSPDGARVASGGNDSTVQVWDARTGRLLVKYSGHTGTVYAVAWSPDGRRIVSGSDDSTVQVWDATSGKLLLTYRGHTAGVRALAWSPDGTRIVSGDNAHYFTRNRTRGSDFPLLFLRASEAPTIVPCCFRLLFGQPERITLGRCAGTISREANLFWGLAACSRDWKDHQRV